MYFLLFEYSPQVEYFQSSLSNTYAGEALLGENENSQLWSS